LYMCIKCHTVLCKYAQLLHVNLKHFLRKGKILYFIFIFSYLPKKYFKIWYIYTMEYYSAIKKNEIMLFTGKWMELEIIM
jgi:hypothetical protein